MHLPIQNTRLATRGLTLVEMLIGMAITLVMMAAVVNLFANIGSGIRVRRASMELGTQLRTARSRLFKDLAGATAKARPKLPSDDHDDGYLEIIDGQWSDSQPSPLTDGNDDGAGPGNFNRELDYTASTVPSSNLNLPAGAVTDGSGLGDYDCILALTVRSESEPFVGRWINPTTNQVETVESDLAEVIWYVIEHPVTNSPVESLGEPGMRTLYRKVLLIAPWLELPDYNSLPGTTLNQKILAYYRNYDISAQMYQVAPNGNLTASATSTIPLVANTLSDLTKREYRFAHTNLSGSATPPFPYIVDQNVIRLLPYDADDPTRTEMISPLRPFGRPFDPTGAMPDRQGEDVMLNDVLAFDLRVYDPGAPLIQSNGVVLEPSDAGWALAASNNDPIVGYGAYVSLGWDPSFFANTSGWQNFYKDPKPPRYNYNYANPPANVPTPLFKEPHSPGWHPINPTDENNGYNFWAVYDTWPYHYEDDGIDQDNRDGDNDPTTGVDEGTDGLDFDGNNGVDDALERETSPPYDHPLRAMQVKIRVYDRDTRQIREATVTRNFVPQ